jgi:hypothetical protein
MLDRPTQSDSKQTSEPDKSYFSAPPTVSLSKGGDALKEMGEKIAVNSDGHGFDVSADRHQSWLLLFWITTTPFPNDLDAGATETVR